MEQYNGEPGALRGACPVLREDCANLPPKGGKAALSYSTPSVMRTLILTIGAAIFMHLLDFQPLRFDWFQRKSLVVLGIDLWPAIGYVGW